MSKRTWIARAVVSCALIAASARDAHARGPDLDAARALFREAGDLEREGRWALAQERLRAAIRIRETPHLHYALGWALENDDKLVEARTEYELALRLSRREHVAEVKRLAMARLAEVDRATPMLSVRVRGARETDARVLVDGRAVALHGETATVPVNPGARLVHVERAGAPVFEQTVYLPRGELRSVDLRAVPPAARATSPASGDSASRGDAHGATLPWALLLAGGAAVGGGVALVAWSTADAGDRDRATARWCDLTSCEGGVARVPESPDATAQRRAAYEASSRGNTKQIVALTLGGAGLVSAAIGAFLLVQHTRPSRAEESPAAGRDRAAARAPRLRVDAMPVAGGALASATLRF